MVVESTVGESTYGVTSAVDSVRSAVARTLEGGPKVVLAVSGGRDSMALLDAAARVRPDRIAAVATFDHGTGSAAVRAADLVEREARRRGFQVVRGRARLAGATEACWRAARWAFLRRASVALQARVATAHTRDDQVETVLLRILRGSGARGLAALRAPSDVVRPLLDVDRTVVAQYATARRVRFVEDPSNALRDRQRNRVRLDLLPALEAASPGLSAELLLLAEEAARLRRDVERLAGELVESVERHEVCVVRQALADFDPESLGLLWPAFASLAGATLDRRGTARLVRFTKQGRRGSYVQLSGGFEAVVQRERLLLRREVTAGAPDAQELGDDLRWGGWHFRRTGAHGEGAWAAALPQDQRLLVRAWRSGDRIWAAGGSKPRRVKGLLRDAGIDSRRRLGWPVVLAGEEVVWIPGVRHSRALTGFTATGAVHIVCERIDH